MSKYSVSQWIYGREPVEAGLDRLARYGYDGVELVGEPDAHDQAKLRRMLGERSLVASSVCGLYGAERDLSHGDDSIRRGAVEYVKACCDLAAETGAGIVIVVPSPVGKPEPTSPVEDELKLAAESIRTAGEYAATVGVGLVIEALNRYETYLVTTIDMALEFARTVDLPNVGVMADAFHMNIEEASPSESVRRAGGMLRHFHLADSNRQAVGRGHLDFPGLLAALDELGYEGWYTMEFLPPTANPYAAAGQDAARDPLDAFTEESIRRMRELRG